MLSLALFVSQGHTAIPLQISYQGYLTNAAGVPVNGTVSMTFTIYDALSGGSVLWTETQSDIPVSHGVYQVTLGAVTPIGLSFNILYFLEIEIGGEVLSPRRAITSVGYAFRASTVDSIGAHTHSGSDITTGTISAARIDSAIARDSEVMTIVLAGDGSGSGLDADMLDGQDGSYYLSLSNHTGTLGVSQGGMGATTASVARSNLGAASSGANSDITSLSGLTTPLSIGQGGTGSATKNFVDLSTSQTVGGAKTFSSPIVSIVGRGTAPLQVVSSTMVTNLNSELHGGFSVSDLDIRYGRVAPVQNPKSNTITTVDSTGVVGSHTSITIGTDGLPVISYRDYTNDDLKVVKCANPFCLNNWSRR